MSNESNKKQLNTLPLDEYDIQIIEILQKDPMKSHNEIGKLIDKSQPAVGARILKLNRVGLLAQQYGINFKNAPISLLQFNIFSNDPSRMKKRVEHCPYILNLFYRTGTFNYQVMATEGINGASNHVLEACLSQDKSIKQIESVQISDPYSNFIIPCHMEFIEYSNAGCPKDCPFNTNIIEIPQKSPKIVSIADDLILSKNLIDNLNSFLNSAVNSYSLKTVSIHLNSENQYLPIYFQQGFNTQMADNFQYFKRNLLLKQNLREFKELSDDMIQYLESDIIIIHELGTLIKNHPIKENIQFLKEFLAIDIKSLSFFPMNVGNQNYGYLFCSATKERHFNSHIIKSLQLLADLISNILIVKKDDSPIEKKLESKISYPL